jgi:hypothetical protein
MSLFQRKYHVNDSFLDSIDHLQAWFLGLMASDGCICSKNQFSLSQSGNHGLKLIESVQNILGHTGNI